MTMRLFLDVDGVINIGPNGHEGNGYDEYRGGGAMGYYIRWSPPMIADLAALGAELWWATTWRSHAPMHIAPLIGYGNPAMVLHPELDPSAQTSFPSIVWKMRAVRRLHERDPKPFIHVDDEFAETVPDVEEHRAWARSNGGLVIGPDHRYGITRDHIALMRVHIAKHGGEA